MRDSTLQKTDIELGFKSDYHRLEEIWTKKIRPNLVTYSHRLWPVLVSNLQATYDLLRSWKKASPDGDVVSWHRSAIEPHEQDQFQQAEDLLINGARDCLEWALKNQPGIGEAWIEAITVMEPQIMRRLAVHGMAECSHKTGNEKLAWLLAKNFLFAPGLKHEVFRLLKIAYPLADAQVRRNLVDELIAQIDTQPIAEEDDAERNEYQKYNILHWLSQAAPGCEDVKQRLYKIQQARPKFEAREHPDFSSWTSSAEWVGPRSPVTSEELLSKPVPEWINYLLEFKGDTFRGPDRSGLLHELGNAVQQLFDWSIDLATILTDRNLWSSDLWGSLIRGWGKSTLTPPDWNKVIKFLNQEQIAQDFSQEISELLQDGAKKEEGGIPSELFENADDLAYRVWVLLSSEEKFEEDKWLGKAINRPAGKLTFFWIYALSKVCKKKDACVEGIPQPYKIRFTGIVTGSTDAALLGRVILVSQLGFLFALDPEWARNNLVPLLSWEKDAKRARQAWNGWLSWGKWNDLLLQEILPYYRQAFSRLQGDLASEQHRFIEHILAIAVYWLKDPIREDLIPQFLRSVGEAQRTALASQMHHFLRNMKDEAKADLWNRWLKSYLIGRNDGIPVPYSGKEYAETFEWLGELGVCSRKL